MKRIFPAIISIVLVVGGLVGGVFVSLRSYREMQWNKEISSEISLLQADADRVEQENKKLRDRIEYLQSDSFREQEAKRVLEYQRSDEKVVSVRNRFPVNEPMVKGLESPVVTPSPIADVDKSPNAMKWWKEFFGSKS